MATRPHRMNGNRPVRKIKTLHIREMIKKERSENKRKGKSAARSVPFLKRELFHRSVNEKAPTTRRVTVILWLLFLFLILASFLLLFSLIIMLFYTFLSRVAVYVGQDGVLEIFFGFPRKVETFACFVRRGVVIAAVRWTCELNLRICMILTTCCDVICLTL